MAYIGERLRRKEDPRLRRGGRFTAGIALPGMLHAVVLRSPYVHAYIRRFDATRARARQGVVGVWSFSDLRDILRPIRVRLGSTSRFTPHLQHPLAMNGVRYVSEPMPPADNRIGCR